MGVPRVVHVVHETEYHYEAPVSQSWQLAHLAPRACARLAAPALQVFARPRAGNFRYRLDR